MIKGNCPQCGETIKPATTQAQFNRTMGIHMRIKHGVISAHNQNRKKPSDSRYGKSHDGTTDSPAVSPEVLKRREYQKAWRRRNKSKGRTVAAVKAKAAQPMALPAFLDKCPHCKARFWMSVD